jgi:hypothetical protein
MGNDWLEMAPGEAMTFPTPSTMSTGEVTAVLGSAAPKAK